MNKVRAGYKMTELGEIPIEWEVKRLEECTNKITDGSHTSPAPVEISNYKICTVANMKKYKLDLENSTNISEEDYIRLIKNGCSAERGDVLLSKDGTVGKTLVYSQSGENIVFLSSIAIIRPQKNILLGEYLNQYLQETRTLERLSNTKTGSAIKRIVLKDIKNIKIIIPKIQEQERLASILSTVDEQIDNVDALIEKNKELKKGLMQTLLIKGIGHTKFKKTEIGEIPEEWEVGTLSSIIDKNRKITYGIVQPGEYVECGKYVIRAKDYSFGWVRVEEIFKCDGLVEKSYARARVKEGDVLLTIVGSVGNLAIVPSVLNEANITQQTARLSFDKNKVNNVFYYNYLKSDRAIKEINKYMKSGVQPSLNLSDVEKFKIVIPSIEEQERISLILSSVDEKVEQYENKKQKLEELKKGLMQQLLTGMIRVTV